MIPLTVGTVYLQHQLEEEVVNLMQQTFSLNQLHSDVFPQRKQSQMEQESEGDGSNCTNIRR